MTQFLSNREIYTHIICGIILQAKTRVWIATADLKDVYVDSGGSEKIPFLKVLAKLIQRGVEVRLIHAKEPGANFREDFDRYPSLWANLKRVLCPRVHFKCIIVDGAIAYFGSANLTGAGMGAKGEQKRNFENGILTNDTTLLAPLMEQFNAVWRGSHCTQCKRKAYCPDGPIV